MVKKMITLKDFEKLDIRIGKVKSAQVISEKLTKIYVDVGEIRQLIVGGGLKPENLLNKNVVVLTNLEPKVIKGVKSEGMILAAVVGDSAVLLIPEKDVPQGTKVK